MVVFRKRDFQMFTLNSNNLIFLKYENHNSKNITRANFQVYLLTITGIYNYHKKKHFKIFSFKLKILTIINNFLINNLPLKLSYLRSFHSFHFKIYDKNLI